jgi:hypothetical protein
MGCEKVKICGESMAKMKSHSGAPARYVCGGSSLRNGFFRMAAISAVIQRKNIV